MNERSGGNGISRAWVLSLAFGIIITGGSGWMTYVQGQIAQVREEQKTDRKSAWESAQETKVIGEKVRRLEEDTREIKQDIKDQGRKLDELLRRTK